MSFSSDFEKKKNKNKTSALLNVPHVVPQKPAHQDNSRRATAARNGEQQRVQTHQNAHRPASTYLTGGSTTRSQPYAANQQRNTVFQQRGNTRQGFPGTGSRSTQQNNLRQPASTYLTGGSVTRSQPYAASQQNQLFSARKAAEQRRNPRQNVSTANKSSGDGNPTLTQFLKNSMDWHKTSDPNRKAQLHAQNDALRRKLGYEYNPQTGASFDRFGHEMTAGVRMSYNSTPTERLNGPTKLLHTSGIMGKTDKATVYPTAMQAAQGLTEDYFSGQTGYNAHKTLYDLFNRSDETWSSEDTRSRDRARQELSNEMSRIMERYGLTYQPRDHADDIMHRLKAAGADEQTLAYVQENIDLRHAADRLGNSMEAVGKRWIASLPSLVDTSRQVSANVEESRQNEEYRQLEEQEQTLELTLQGMNSTAADGSVPADYQAVYNQLQEVRKRKNELTVNKGVDPNKWSQRMLREANEAQANAEAGLAPAPRWLTEQGISLAGNAPVMAASAIPVVGPAVGSIMMGSQAAGQRSFELNEQGKGARESLTRGLTSGAIEAATERLPLGQMSKILHSGGTNAVKSILRQMGVEAGEESASYFLNYVADKAAQDPDAKFSLQELAQSAAGGAFGGLVFGTAGAVTSRGVYGSPTENQLTNRPMMNYELQADTPYLQVEQFTEPLTQTMVKIDEQMRKAETLPEGTIKQQYTAALQEDAQRVSKQLSILENNRAELMQARNIAERFGAKFELADLGPAGGKYENGTITVNPYSSSPVRQVLVHELTHHLENSGSYNALQDMALHLFTQEQGVSADVLRDNITRMYAEQGVTLDTQAANRELTAAFCEKRLFQDDASIQRLAQTDVSLFQRIRQWIADTVIRLRGTKEQQQLLELQRRYEKAARTVGAVQDRGAQYKIETLPDGKQYVKSDRQVIEGDDASAWNKQAEQFINEKIRNHADLRVFTKDGFAIDITERSAYKLSDPHVQSIEKVDRPLLDDTALRAKMEAAGHIDELAEIARWNKWSPDRYNKHSNDIGEDGFDTFTTYFEDSDGQYYRVKFSAGVNANGSINGDTDTAYSIGFMQKRNHPSSDGSSNSPFGSGAHTQMISKDSIAPDNTNGNTSGTKFKGLALQREYRQAVEGGNMERAREILAEKAARRGYVSYDATADAQNHIIQNANPVEDDYHTWIRNAGDVHSFAEVLNDSDWNGMDFDPDYTWDMAQKALQTGEITVYSSYPIGTLGGFVTPSRMEAEGYAGNGEVYSKTVNLDDIAWIDPTQGQYAPTQNGSIYKQGSPYAKIPDVTYDDNGKLIPLSQRYDDSRTDSRYTLGFTPEQIAKGTVPLTDAMQYGKTPEQAVMEARAKAEGEKFSAGVNANGSINGDTDTAYSIGLMDKRSHPSNTGSSNSPFGSGAHTQMTSDNSISPNAENGNTEVKPLGNYEMYGKSKEQAMRELQNKLTNKRSFLHDDDSKQVRAVQSAELRETWEQARPVHEQIEKFQKNHPLSTKDEQLLQAAMVNGATNTFSQCDDPAAVMHRYQLQQELNRRMQPIRDYQRARGETMALNAEEMADTIAEFAKDKKIPGAYSRETMERNSYDIFGEKNRAYAEQLNDEYFTPVHKAVADRTNYVNTMRQQVADLHLSKHESALVQMALEGRNDVAAEYIKNNKIKVTSKLQKNVADGVATFQAIYKELYEALNETLLSNGMEPVRARKNYAPHFVKDKPDTLLSRIRYSFGWGKDSSVNIGTDLAGITDDFSPGKKWFGNLLQREGELTDYDALAGFDRYIETAGDVIFLTDSVQQLRSLEDALRYRLSDEGTKEKVNQIRNDRSLNALERHQKIQDAYDSNTDNIQKLYNQKKQGMGGYVSNLHEYINNLAGKKARADRGWEEMIGRQMYTVAKNVEGRVAANMIAMNPGSWITNFIPITQASGEVSTANLIRAMRDTVKSAVKDDGFTDSSVFLTNREGTQFLDRTLTRKISDIAGMPMEAIDHFASNVVTRAKYLQNIQDGMGLQEAFDNADTFAANLMADRSKGAQPTAFNSVNPIRKVFTMFQLEVNNQLSYLFKDLPRAKQSVPKLAWAYTKVFTGAYLFNAVYHQLTGRDSAFDPISIVGDAFDLDPLELIAEAFGLGDDDDKDKKKKSGVDIALDLGENVAEQIPFVGGLLGGGRVPISSAFPDFGKLKEEYENGYDGKRIALDAAKSAANSAAYLLLPFGGGALKRTAEGAATVYAGGSYSLDKNGEKILQFPTYGQSPRDWAQAMLFGKSSLKTAQEWADDDYNSLNADETKVFEELRQRMSWNKDENGNTIDNSEAVFAAIKAMKATTADAKKKYGLQNYKEIAAASIRKMLLENNDLTPMQKKTLDRELITAGDSADYNSQDAFDISQYVRESRQDDAAEAIKHGISVDDFVKWDSVIEQTLADNYVDAKDYEDGENNQLYAKNAVLQNILDEFDKAGEHTDAEKNAFADYVLVSAMGESDKERWDAVKGTVNATDFVQFAGDMATYNKEYKGSGLSKSDAMQSILDGYKNLSDTQKDALFGAYSDSASGNAFHISIYEDAIKDRKFYSYLKDAGKKELRSMLNSYENHVADNDKLSGWEAKAAVAKEAGISPGVYALYQMALKAADTDGKGVSQAKAKAAVESIDGLTQAQKAYLWQSSNRKWKKNPFGSATVSKYQYAGGEFANPVAGGTISSKFGPRDTFATSNGASSSRWHKSIDIAAPAGTAIKSVKGGKVTANGWVSGYGWTIEVTHDNGYVSMYHHMQNQSSVAVGTEVKQGQTIGNVGSTGNSTGPHLDLTITKDGTPVDPASLIGDYKNAKTGYVYEGSPVYTQLSSAASKSKKSSGGSRKSGGSSSGGLKQLKGLSGLKGLGF